ncbi:ribonuclease H-like domain-containing protein [Candidatus Woesebacteria bacterium]|nr:ribonuclease H-like domain-containing protein [Candidatus Woesebacteria bacterium]
MINEVIFDVETKKLFSEIEGDNPGDLGVSVISLYNRSLDDSLNEISGKMLSFWENDFPKMWEYFQNADRIIGFNTFHFDIPALQPYSPFPFERLKHFDIMDQVKASLGKRISLDSIAKETLDTEKIDVGINAVLYWKKGDKESLDKLKRYCESDVDITKQVYDFGFKNSHLMFKDKWNTVRRFDVDFSYPENEIEIKQEGLF